MSTNTTRNERPKMKISSVTYRLSHHTRYLSCHCHMQLAIIRPDIHVAVPSHH